MGIKGSIGIGGLLVDKSQTYRVYVVINRMYVLLIGVYVVVGLIYVLIKLVYVVVEQV